MRLPLRQTDLRRPAPDRRRRSHPAPRPVRDIEPVAPEARVRQAGGPEDTAHYSCTCGFRFDADVSTSVSCPHCGTLQAW